MPCSLEATIINSRAARFSKPFEPAELLESGLLLGPALEVPLALWLIHAYGQIAQEP